MTEAMARLASENEAAEAIGLEATENGSIVDRVAAG
jgi:hypothetical protein